MSGPSPGLPRSSRIALRCSGTGDFLEQVLDLENLVGDVPEDLLEPAVLLPGAVAIEDVVEEKLLHHRRHHAVDLRSRQVDEDDLSFPISEVTRRLMQAPRWERGIL
jgi:hypothetical protein